MSRTTNKFAPACGTHGAESRGRSSTYHERIAQRRDPERLSDRARRDQDLKPEAVWVFAENFGVYGVRKVWRQMNREGFPIARNGRDHR